MVVVLTVRSVDRIVGVVENPLNAIMHRFQPVLIVALRIIFGLLFAGISSGAFIAVAWGLFVFSSSQSAQAWSILQLLAAGTGGGE